VEAADIDGISQALEKILFSAAPPARTRVDRFRWSNLAQDYLAAIAAAGSSRALSASRTDLVTRTDS
jgi:hypothetical protein